MERFFISTSEKPPATAKVYALGTFDGVHVGHMELLREALRLARDRGARSGVYTFNVHPLAVLNPSQAPQLLTSLDDRLKLIEKAGIDTAVVQSFDMTLAGMSQEDFVAGVLVSALSAEHVVCGFDYTFGRHGVGTARELVTICARHGIGVTVVPPVTEAGTTVGSTAVRAALARGDVALVSRLLGRPHFVRGIVERGRGVGRALGVPTANLRLPQGYAIPSSGVYAVRAHWGDGMHATAVCNIGVRPTFGDEARGVTCEVHLVDACADLYGEILVVEFMARLRNEKRFAGPADLREQIASDIEAARTLVSAGVYTQCHLC
jgi:riboflavin kinase/FMN adenylyltransferase